MDAATVASPQHPLVSVVIPTHNRPRLLARALRSVLDQTLEDFEVVLVNDGGASVEPIVAALGSSRIRLLEDLREAQGAAVARNRGLSEARGKYVAYLDDDDIYLPNHLALLANALERSSQRVAYSDALRAHTLGDGDDLHVVYRDRPYAYTYERAMLMYANQVPTLCIMHERALIDETGSFDTEYSVAEDWELWCRMAMRTDFLYIPQVTCEYIVRVHGVGLTLNAAHRYPGFEHSIRRRNGSPLDGSGLARYQLLREQRGILGNFGIGEAAWVEQSLRTLFKCAPHDTQLATEIAIFALLRGDAEEGLALLRSGVSRSPGHGFACLILAYGELLRGNARAGLEALHAAPLSRQNHSVHIAYGDCFLALGEFAKASERYQTAIALKARHTAPIARLSNLQVLQDLSAMPAVEWGQGHSSQA